MRKNTKKSLKSILILFLVTTFTASGIAQNKVQTIEYVRTAKFGKEIVYYGEDNEVLNGTFKIAERSGAYSEATFIDGKPDGKWSSYDSSGRLEHYSTFENGVGNGKGESYDQKGNVLNTYAFKNGEQHGEFIYRGEHGVYSVENYNEGSKEGKWVKTSRDYNGTINSVETEYYKNNEPVGTWESVSGDGKKKAVKKYSGPESYSETNYFQNGEIKSIVSMSNHRRDGKQESYYENGFKKEESNYDKGLKLMEKKYHKNGKLALSATFNVNGPVGVMETFNKKGQTTRHTPYTDGHLNGIDITYHFQNGNKYVEQEYKDDIKDGIYKEYYSDGELYLSGQRVKGQREGKWTYYGDNGKVERERVYENDNQVSDTRYD